jgi:drug/metabolite transporter (DMT)-like permease
MNEAAHSADGRQLLMGYLTSFGAAAGYGTGTYFALLVIRDHASPMTATAFTQFFGLLVMVALFARPALADLKVARRRAWVVVSMSGLASAWGVASLYLALGRVPVVVAAPITGINPLVAILMTYLFLKRLERVSRRTVIGALLVVAGVALVAVGRG